MAPLGPPLCEDIWLEVASFLPLHAMLQLSMVCKFLCYLLNSERVYKSLLHQTISSLKGGFIETPDLFEEMAKIETFKNKLIFLHLSTKKFAYRNLYVSKPKKEPWNPLQIFLSEGSQTKRNIDFDFKTNIAHSNRRHNFGDLYIVNSPCETASGSRELFQRRYIYDGKRFVSAKYGTIKIDWLEKVLPTFWYCAAGTEGGTRPSFLVHVDLVRYAKEIEKEIVVYDPVKKIPAWVCFVSYFVLQGRRIFVIGEICVYEKKRDLGGWIVKELLLEPYIYNRALKKREGRLFWCGVEDLAPDTSYDNLVPNSSCVRAKELFDQVAVYNSLVFKLYA